MSYFPHIDFFITSAPIGIPVSFQAELDCEGEDETEINTKKAAARADLIDKYNIEEV